jgi:fructose 1,6-bisphosphatase
MRSKKIFVGFIAVVTISFLFLSPTDYNQLYTPRGVIDKNEILRLVRDTNPLHIRTEFTVPEGQAENFFTNDYQSYRIGELLATPLEQIPDEVVIAIRAKLDQDIAEGKILSAEVRDFGGTDIDIHVTHKYGELNAAVQRVILEAMREGVLKANELGLLRQDIDVASMSLSELAKVLRVKYVSHSITERPSEPVVMVKMIGAGIGAANIKLYHEFFITGSTPLQKLGFVPGKAGVRGFRAIVRRTEDVLKGNFDGPVWEFEKSAASTVDGIDYPSKDESLELLALASQPNDFLITAIYPVEGSKLTSDEPLVSVVYQPVYGEEGKLRTLNPTFICRSQSGGDAVGGIAGIFDEPNFVPGGPNGEYFVVTKPVTLEEARKAPEEGTASVVIYGWQSKNGVIPQEEGNIIDHVGMNLPAVQYERNLADWLASVMRTHKDEQPYLSAFAAQQRVAPLREAQAHLFIRAPRETDIDPFMDEVEAKVARGEFLSVTDDKADMGGKFGHNFTPPYMLAIDLATVMEAVENGTLSDGNIIGYINKARLAGTTMSIGDDSHVLMLGDKSRNSAEAHQLSFLAFTRGYYAAVVNGEKPYGLGQDYQGVEAQAAKANPIFYSRFTERFFEILREVMPSDYMGMVDKMEAGWREWQKTNEEATVLPEPFSGNVSQQGIGTARYLMDIKGGERTFDVLAGDKMGPAALNRVIREGVYSALNAGEFENGLVFEIWDAKAFDENGDIPIEKLPESLADVTDYITSLQESDQNFVTGCYTDGRLRTDLTETDKVKLAKLIKQAGYVPTERIFLDAQQDKEAIYLYLADSDRFNIKQIWTKKRADWNINNPQVYLNRPILGSSVTKLGILAGGEYVGKDDPVMVGDTTLMEYIYAFLRDNPLIIQGDMNGSHWLGAIPTAFSNAVASKDSHPILVGFRYTLSDDGKSLAHVESVFDSTDFDSIREKMFKFNFRFKQAQLGGQFEPYGTNWRTVEASYPLANLLRALQAPDSPFLVSNKPESEQPEGILRAIAIINRIRELFNVATTGGWGH